MNPYDLKPLYLSRTFWGGLAAVAAGTLGLFGYVISDADQAQLVELVTALAAVAGGITAIAGRVRATKRIGPAEGGGPLGPGAAGIVAAAFLMLLAMGLTGCEGTAGRASSGFYGTVKQTWPLVRDEYGDYVMQDPTLGTPGELTDERIQILRTPAIIDKAIELEGVKQTTPAPPSPATP